MQAIQQQAIYSRLKITPEQLANFCQQNSILELALFGSILRDDFRPDSDIDFLAFFDPNPELHISLLDLVGMEYELAEMVGREVDLVDKRSILSSHNWLRRNHILTTAQVIYEQGRIVST